MRSAGVTSVDVFYTVFMLDRMGQGHRNPFTISEIVNNFSDLNLNQTLRTPQLLDGANRLGRILLAIFSTRTRC